MPRARPLPLQSSCGLFLKKVSWGMCLFFLILILYNKKYKTDPQASSTPPNTSAEDSIGGEAGLASVASKTAQTTVGGPALPGP
jgi:hypothetical protein